MLLRAGDTLGALGARLQWSQKCGQRSLYPQEGANGHSHVQSGGEGSVPRVQTLASGVLRGGLLHNLGHTRTTRLSARLPEGLHLLRHLPALFPEPAHVLGDLPHQFLRIQILLLLFF